MRAVLLLHSVDSSGSVLSISGPQLEGLVDAVRDSGHDIVSLRALLDEPAADDRIALTFDDGVRSLHEEGLPLLDRLRTPATVFLVTDHVGRTTRWPSLPDTGVTMPAVPELPMMSWSQVCELDEAGWSVEAHTATHPDLRRLPDDAIGRELDRCDAAIEEHVGRRPQILAYPYGRHDARVRAAAAGRYRYAVTARMGTLAVRLDDPLQVPRLETYYFRAPAAHRRFGSRSFAMYLGVRSLLRKLRHE